MCEKVTLKSFCNLTKCIKEWQNYSQHKNNMLQKKRSKQIVNCVSAENYGLNNKPNWKLKTATNGQPDAIDFDYQELFMYSTQQSISSSVWWTAQVDRNAETLRDQTDWHTSIASVASPAFKLITWYLIAAAAAAEAYQQNIIINKLFIHTHAHTNIYTT